MKNLFIVIISLFIIVQSYADCSNSGLWVTPQGETLKQNSIIIVNGYARSEHIIHSLSKGYEMYLISDAHKVKLTVKSTHQGMFLVSQAILEHSELLKPGKTYSLYISKSKKGISIIRKWNSKTRKDELLSWKVEDYNDIKAPEFLEFPKYLDEKINLYGCGPEVKIKFDFNAKDESAILVLTELVDISTGESYSYYLNSANSEISVGHGMCSGPFRYKEKTRYKIRFQLMDLCGNENKKWSPWVEFDSPLNK